MGRAIAAMTTASAGILPRLGLALLAFWLELTGIMFGGYRPEKHYMRGPGPAWRKRHGSGSLL